MSRLIRIVPTAVLLGALSAGAVAAAAEGALPGKNGRIFYTQERGQSGKLYSTTASGKGARAIPRQASDGSEPSVSPDGERVAFQSFRNGNAEIYVMNVNGQRLKRLTKSRKTFEQSPTWSPDGRRIAFQAGAKNAASADVYSMRSTGGGRKRLTSAPGVDGAPAWSPDGRQIAFHSNRPGSDGYDLYVMAANGTGQRKVTSLPNDEGEPSWSPDGSRLALSSAVFVPALVEVRDEIFTVALDGTALVRITTDDAFDFTPTWSPDGRRIAFVSNRGGSSYDVYSASAVNGGSLVRVTRTRFDETHADWSRAPRR